MHNKPLVGIVMGSISDNDIMDECVKTLKEMDIKFRDHRIFCSQISR